MTQKHRISHESRPFDYIYDQTYSLTARDFAKADNFARHHFLSARQTKKECSDLDGLLTVRPLLASSDNQSNNNQINAVHHLHQSIVVQGRESPRYVSSVNRYKFISAPISSSDHQKRPLAMPKQLLYTPIQTPAVPTEETRVSAKGDLESSLRSSSSGYNSVRSQSIPTSAKVQAIIERLYHGHQPGRQCSRCSYNGLQSQELHTSVSQSPLLPDVNAKDIELVESMRAKRRLGRLAADHCQSAEAINETSSTLPTGTPQRSISSRRLASSPRKQVESPSSRDCRVEDYLRERLAIHNETLRKEIDEKLKRMRIRHDRALQRLRDEAKPRSTSTERTYRPTQQPFKNESKTKSTNNNQPFKVKATYEPVDLAPAFVTDEKPFVDNGPAVKRKPEMVKPKLSTVQCTNDDDDTVEKDSSDPKQTIIETLVDGSVIQEEVIKPLIDYVLSDSIMCIANFRANEDAAQKLSSVSKTKSLLNDVNEFLYKEIIPESIRLVYEVLNIKANV